MRETRTCTVSWAAIGGALSLAAESVQSPTPSKRMEAFHEVRNWSACRGIFTSFSHSEQGIPELLEVVFQSSE